MIELLKKCDLKAIGISKTFCLIIIGIIVKITEIVLKRHLAFFVIFSIL